MVVVRTTMDGSPFVLLEGGTYAKGIPEGNKTGIKSLPTTK
jgi:hypothetical protein